ncbi:hypothetical protein BDV98DRAFT_90051 [Pterulicium gracile]|uniref:F-box domain-containing protein n=1 Tax=Pterulicium gracile TaxID=1884261 RepID=A0A5C3QLN9_9AGAR|nr:hypothetical protein BDV98DRAFT_90051 [Pterula gracilis]
MHTLLGSRMQRCTIRNWPRDDVDSDDEESEKAVLQVILGLYILATTRMPNIRMLRLENTFIDDELFSAVEKCRHLTRLEIIDCVFDTSEAMIVFTKKARTGSPLRGLAMKDIRVKSTSAPMEITALFQKAIGAWKDLTHFRATSILHLSDFFALRNPDKLRTVILGHIHQDPQRFADFLLGPIVPPARTS